MNKKISELPDAPYQKYAIEAEKRGISVTNGIINDPVSVILIGALDMIRELSEKIKNLEENAKKDK